MSASSHAVVRRELHCSLTAFEVLSRMAVDSHPFALVGAWAGAGAVVGARPVAQAGPPQPLDSVFGPWPAEGLLGAAPEVSFAGGWVGYLGYRATGVARFDAARLANPADPALQAWWFGWYDHVLVQDARDHSWRFEALVEAGREAAAEARYRELARRLQGDQPSPGSYRCGEFTVTPDPQAHIDAVTEAVRLIHRGDLFQANITLRLEAGFSGDPLALFCRGAAALNPPYAAFLSPPGGAIASFSPELFLRRSGREILTRPIKGTISRSHDAASAARQRAELIGSAKNRAENVMIVDLMRSDLGRVCVPGTVTVPRLAFAEPHPGVWHLVSEVRGEMAEDRTDTDLIAATFPPGSVTGAPKVRALEVIGALETAPRQVYTGAVGYRSPVAGLELSVAIRTFELGAGKIWLGAGGGIVAGSDPAAEYAECLVKAGPLIEAVAIWPGDTSLRAGPDARQASLRPRPAAGVFTTLRVAAGEPDGLAEHLDRLAASARAVFGKDLPSGLLAEIGSCLAIGESGRLRITIRPVGGPLEFRVELAATGAGAPAVRLRPVTVAGGLGSHKWTDRRLLAALADDRSLGRDEQLLLTDTDGTVLETDRASVFAVIDGVLRTPAADGRILPGIARERVLEAAQRSDVATEVGRLELADLRGASEVFVTNSLRGIVPVTALSDPLCNWPPGPVSRLAVTSTPAVVPVEIRARGYARSSSRRPTFRRPVPIILLDNYDSFTYNLVHVLTGGGCPVEVIRNDEMAASEVAAIGAAGLVISPGPCGPADAGVCVDVVRALGGRIPVLGVCLGHEVIAAAYGATVEVIAPVHGQASVIEHDGRGIFAGLPPRFEAARYHSLALAERSLPDCLSVSARTADGLPMAIRHVAEPVDGVQFHPESILTPVGAVLIANFLRAVREANPDRSA
jgi:para-aminobenzoate synthetase/4-amino-4-deoxychorismate lyase